MRIIVEIPDLELESARELTGAHTAEEAIAKAISMFVNDRQKRRELSDRLYGSIPDFMSQEEMQRLRNANFSQQ